MKKSISRIVMRRSCLLFPVLLALISSCATDNSHKTANDKDIPVDSVKGHIVADLTQSDILSPQALLIVNDSLYVIDDGDTNSMCYLLDSLGNIVATGIGKGQGPHEALEITSIHRRNDKAVVYDSRKGALADLICSDGKIVFGNEANDLRLYDDAFRLSDSTFLTAPVGESFSYAIVSLDKNIVDSTSYFPPKPDGVSDVTHSLACSGYMEAIPNKNVFARTLVYDGGVDFFTISNGKIRHENRYEIFPMSYSVLNQGPGVPIPNEESRTGFTRLSASDGGFFVGFSEEKANDNPSGLVETIYEFAIDGKPTRILQTDAAIGSFSVTENGKDIYALQHDETNGHDLIVRFHLP